jgi:carbonic anhydrase
VAYIADIAANVIPDGPLFEVAIIHHTQCGGALRDPAMLDPGATASLDADRLRAAASVPARVPISAYLYDVTTGLVENVRA